MMSNNPVVDLGLRIRARRRSLGLTQEELAHTSGLDRSYIGAVERGARNITIASLATICLALKCDIAELTKDIPERHE